MVRFFFDTYALIELVKSSPNYVRFLEEVVITTKFNLVELYYIILQEFGEEKAKEIYYKFEDSAFDVDDENIIFKAMAFRLKNKKKNFSYVDCIGYIYAIENDMRFLTGDESFRGFDDVEFVKK